MSNTLATAAPCSMTEALPRFVAAAGRLRYTWELNENPGGETGVKPAKCLAAHGIGQQYIKVLIIPQITKARRSPGKVVGAFRF